MMRAIIVACIISIVLAGVVVGAKPTYKEVLDEFTDYEIISPYQIKLYWDTVEFDISCSVRPSFHPNEKKLKFIEPGFCNVIFSEDIDFSVSKLCTTTGVQSGGYSGGLYEPLKETRLCLEFPPQMVNESNVLKNIRNITKINSSYYQIHFGSLYNNSVYIEYQTISTHCDVYDCDEVVSHGDVMTLDGNESMLMWWPFLDSVTDLGKYHLVGSEVNSPSYETIIYDDWDSRCIRFQDNSPGSNEYATFTITDGVNLTDVNEWSFAVGLNHSEGSGAHFTQFYIQDDLVLDPYDDYAYYYIKYDGTSDSMSSALMKFGENDYWSVGLNYDEDLSQDATWWNLTGGSQYETSVGGFTIDRTTGYLGKDGTRDDYATDQCMNYISIFDDHISDNQMKRILKSKHGGFFELLGSTFMNFTFGGTADTVNVSFTAEDLGDESSVCFMLMNESSQLWRCSNTTDITISESMSEVWINWSLNTTNATISPLLKQMIVYPFNASGGEPCEPSIVNTSWSDWSTYAECNESNLTGGWRNLTQYDENACGGTGNTTFYEYNETACEYTPPCENDLQNVTGSWVSITACNTSDLILQTRNITQYDANVCGNYSNVTYVSINNQTISCNYCSYSFINITAWTNETESCGFRLWRDVNWGTCANVTGLVSDVVPARNDTNLENYTYNVSSACPTSASTYTNEEITEEINMISYILGLGIFASVLLFFAFNVEKEHFLLKLINVFFSLYALMLIPTVIIDADDGKITFLKMATMYFRIFVTYFFVYLGWHWAKQSETMLKIFPKMKKYHAE